MCIWDIIIITPAIQIAACDVCQRSSRKPLFSETELHPVPIHSPWFHVGIDFVGPKVLLLLLPVAIGLSLHFQTTSLNG